MEPSRLSPEAAGKPQGLIAKDRWFSIAAYISSGEGGIAAALRKHVEEEARHLSSEDLLSVMDQLYEQISSLLQSNDATESLLALHAIDALIDLPVGGASKVSKLANVLKNVFEVKRDPEILVPASTVLGHLANAGGALTGHEVERQIITTALGWLGADRVEYRRFAALLILKEMAENAFTVFKNYIPEFVDVILKALSDPKLVIRERAALAVRALAHSNMQAAADCGVKKVKREGIDLISDLPDETLCTIISFLRTDDAVRTSALSRRWRHLWRSASINLDTVHIPGFCPEQIEVVTEILSEHQGPIRRLHLNSLYFADLDGWFRSPALANLQEFDIYVAKFDDVLPLSVLRFAPTLRVARIAHCSFFEDEEVPVFNFPYLKTLVLGFLSVYEGTLHSILSGCPVLEDLLLDSCDGFRRLVINSQTLRSIGVCNDMGSMSEIVIENAPCLERFVRSDLFRRTSPLRRAPVFRVISAPKLAILGSLTDNVDKLKLGTRVSQQEMVAGNLEMLMRGVKVLNITSSGPNLDAVLGFLRVFPFLEKLYIMSSLQKDMQNVHHHEPTALIESLHHIRYVELKCYTGTDSDVDFAKFFVHNAKALELMKFVVEGRCTQKWRTDQYKCLQFDSRASPNALLDFRSYSGHAYPAGCIRRGNHHNEHVLSMANPFDSSSCSHCRDA
ncbi:F-box/FBD/LRR-repeat protein At1g16930-like isoform X1 [Triticum dicoccoides]|uniref:F-box/FBD/LRR-repeat protein At1g16930-like isoform X1 n=1 Tax=Triticum dicoccoides TaxID=85692 RepID=UPI00188FE659|nr:F-box/FBD/LRR-repeat protein At1g16930-like isoform X1 [Triticum dicoccoides]